MLICSCVLFGGHGVGEALSPSGKFMMGNYLLGGLVVKVWD